MNELLLIKNINKNCIINDKNEIFFTLSSDIEPTGLNINIKDQTKILFLLIYIFINCENGNNIELDSIKSEINDKIKIVFDGWIESNQIRKLLLINNDFNDVLKLNEKVEVFKNLSSDQYKHFYKYLKYKLKYYKKNNIIKKN